SNSLGSFRFVLSLVLAEDSFRLLDVSYGEFAGFDEASHDGLRAAAKESEKVVDQFALRGFARDGSLEDVKITDFLDAPHSFVCLGSAISSSTTSMCNTTIWICIVKPFLVGGVR